jgi:hypothetical protein
MQTALRALIAAARALFSHAPLISGILESNRRQWREAIEQFRFILLITMFPPLITAFIQLLLIKQTSGSTFFVYEFIRPGELLISTMGLIAPTLWVMHDFQRRKQPFENYTGFIITILFVVVGSTVLFVLDKSNCSLDFSKALVAGVSLYALGLLLWFLSLLYQARLFTPYEEYQRAEEDRLVNRVETFDPRHPTS